MINVLRDSVLHPDIKVGVQITASMNTGDGVFANTDLMDLPDDGFLIVNIVGDNVANVVEVPQVNHHPTYTNAIPVLNAGKAPDILRMVNYKVRCSKGSKPCIMVTMTGSNAYALGCFFRGRNNPVGQQTPDIVVAKSLAATTANALENTDLADPNLPGFLYTWFWSNQVDSQIAVRQRNYRTGNYSLAPYNASGGYVDISMEAPFKEYVLQGGKPSVTITEVTGMAAFLVSAFYINTNKVPEQALWGRL